MWVIHERQQAICQLQSTGCNQLRTLACRPLLGFQ